MEALMSGMRQWIQNLDVKNEGHKQEFEKGLQRLVDTSSFDNGVWQVMCCASACAAKKEEDYQALKNQFEELNQQRSGGVFSNADDRVGDHDKLKPIVCESDPPEVPVHGDLGLDETIGGVDDIHCICTTFDCDEPSIIRDLTFPTGIRNCVNNLTRIFMHEKQITKHGADREHRIRVEQSSVCVTLIYPKTN
ncbi:hypothetical protein T484DRAFT_1757673 [Baffinella frigidus]|nr:hypothetical protein T484DRAFT_1757673 [Cryptophyta sp. CCMP2293]